jgi:very-short-patch-repair endonuclease
MLDAPDPDWYFDHVLSDAEPGAPPASKGPVSDWRRWTRAVRAAVKAPPFAGDIVLTRAAVRRRGVDEAAVRRQLRAGTWWQPVRGTVSPVVVEGDDHVVARRRHALTAAAVALLRPGQVVSGRSAAILHGLPTIEVPDLVELTADGSTTAGRHGRALVRTAALRPDEIMRWFGVPVTVPAVTVVDVARRDRREGIVVIDAALRERVARRTGLEAVLARSCGRPGVRQARELVALGSPRAESPLESVVRLALHDDGFPPPSLQALIGDERVDMLWRSRRLIVEADGRLKYRGDLGGDVMWREKKRERRLSRLGYEVVRVFWADVFDDWPATSAYLRAKLAS